MSLTESLATALYGRTSKDDPKTVTIDIQKKTLRDWAQHDPLVDQIIDEYWDDGISGKIPLAERPEGSRLITDLSTGKIACIAVAFSDRFGRTLLDGLQAVKALEERGIKLVAVNDGWDARRNDSPLYFQFRMMMAEEEHRRITKRMNDGKLRAMERDNAPPGGPLTFGYRMDARGHYLPDPDEAPIVIRIFEMFLAGHSQAQILSWVHTTGVSAGLRHQKRLAGSPVTITSNHHQARWHPTKIGKILRCQTYLGERRWSGKIFPCPPLIDQETWDRTQTLLNHKNPGTNLGKGYHPGRGLLGGLLQCTLCGARYYHWTHHARGIKREYYACTNIRETGPRKCCNKLLRIDQLDAQVWHLIENYLEDPEAIVRKVLTSDRVRTEAAADLADTEAQLLHDLEQIEADVAVIWAEQQAHNWPMSWVSPKLDQLNARRQTTSEQLADVRRQRAHVLIDQEETQAITAAIARIRSRLAAGLTNDEKYEIVRLVIAGGTVRPIGHGGHKTAQVTIQLKWGEAAFPEVPNH